MNYNKEENIMTQQQAAPTEAQNQSIPVVVAQNAKSTSYANVFNTQVMDGGIAVSCGISQAETHNTENGPQTVLAVYLENRIMMTLDSAARLANSLSQAVQQAVAAQQAERK